MNKVENKKELIRQAAIKVMSQQGFYNTKASQIANEAGIAVGTIYNYFKNKEAILDYIFEVELEKRLNILKGLEDKNIGIWEKLSIFLNNHFEEIRKNIAVGEILVKEKEFPRKNGSESINNYLNNLPSSLKKLLDKAQKNGEIKESVNITVLASVIFGGIQGLVEKAINTDPAILNQAPQQLIEIFKNGIEQ